MTDDDPQTDDDWMGDSWIWVPGDLDQPERTKGEQA